MYTIYVKQSSIQIGPKQGQSERLPKAQGKPNVKLSIVDDAKEVLPRRNLDWDAPDLLFEIRNFLDTTEIRHLEICSDHPKQVLKYLKHHLKYIKAAGGLVKNEKKQFLFIHRLGYWDLPKGKIEAGEKIQNAAIREVEEETGVKISLVKKELPSTYHIYEMEGQIILKRTYWFLMKAYQDQHLIPQSEEGISEARWVSLNEIAKLTENTYPSIIEVLHNIPQY